MSDTENKTEKDTGNDNTEDESTQSTQETLYVCKKCPGKTFSFSDIEKHRDWHRSQKKKKSDDTNTPQTAAPLKEKSKNKANKPGPLSSKRKRRDLSPAPSKTHSLFSIPVEDDPKTAQNRKQRAATKHKKHRKAHQLDAELTHGG